MDSVFIFLQDCALVIGLLIVSCSAITLLLLETIIFSRKKLGKDRPALLSDLIYKSYLSLFFSIYAVGCMYQSVFYIGFKTTAPIDGMPTWLQAHCHFPYNAEHEQYMQSVWTAMDYF